MRLFISIDLPKEVKDYLFDLQKRFYGLGKINWVSKRNLHLTLKFFGEVKDSDLNEIEKILNEIKFNKFRISLMGSGVFPTKSYIRILWIGLSPISKIMDLQKKIDEELLLKFPKDQKFLVHLTLGRIKFLKNKEKFLELLEELKIEELSFNVDSFGLIKSELTKDGPKYEVLKKYDLV